MHSDPGPARWPDPWPDVTAAVDEANAKAAAGAYREDLPETEPF
jgi:hypothetical protein